MGTPWHDPNSQHHCWIFFFNEGCTYAIQLLSKHVTALPMGFKDILWIFIFINFLWHHFQAILFFLGHTKKNQNLPILLKKNYTRSFLGSVPKTSPMVIEHPTTTNIQPKFHEHGHKIVFSFCQNGGHMEVCTYVCPNPNMTCATNKMKMLNQQNVDWSHPKRCQCHQSLMPATIKNGHMKFCTYACPNPNMPYTTNKTLIDPIQNVADVTRV